VFNFFSCKSISDEVYDLGACEFAKIVTHMNRMSMDIFFIIFLFFNRKVHKGFSQSALSFLTAKFAKVFRKVHKVSFCNSLRSLCFFLVPFAVNKHDKNLPEASC